MSDSLMNVVTILNDYNGLILVLLTCAYVIFTYFLVRIGQKSIKQISDLEFEKMRPFVIFDIVSENGDVHFVLENIGTRQAVDVVVRLLPEPERSEGFNLLKSSLLNNKIKFIAPGRKLIDFFDSGYGFVKDRKDEELLFDVSIIYRDRMGSEFQENYIIDLSYQRWVLRTSVPCIEKEVEHIRKSIQNLTSSVIQVEKNFSEVGKK